MNKTTEALKLALEKAQMLMQPIPDKEVTALEIAKAVSERALELCQILEEALAEPVKQEPVVYYAYATIKEYEELAGFSVSQAFRAGWYMARTTNSMLGINAAPVQPVKQKPVGEVDLHKELGQLRWMGGDEGWDNAIHAVRKRLEELYAAPVSAKREWVDLTDDEIEDAVGWTMTEGEMLECRAVITAFKEKNK